MRRVLLWILLALALPAAAFGSSVDFTNSGGTLAGNNSGLALTGSTLSVVKGFGGGGLITGNLGSVALTTGALISGSLQMGGTFAAGGSFTITGNGSDGLPNGTIFTGTFNAPVSWTLITLSNGTHNYTLTGTVTGNFLGAPADGVTVQLTVNTGTSLFNGSVPVGSGDTSIQVTVPEPGSLGLLSTGLLGIAALMRRKVKG